MLLVAAAAVILWTEPLPPVEDVAVLTPLGDTVPARLYVPAQPRRLAVVCVQSVFAWVEVATPMARELARHGYLALDVPLQPYSQRAERWKSFEDYRGDVEAALDHLSRRQDVAGVALVGQSMGADLACSAAGGRSVQALVALGFPVAADRSMPRNLLMAVGLFDQLHPLEEMRAALRNAAPGDELDVLYGAPADGTARRLIVLPHADHVMENFDGDAMAATIHWLDAASGHPPRALEVRSRPAWRRPGSCWRGASAWPRGCCWACARRSSRPSSGSARRPSQGARSRSASSWGWWRWA